MPTEEEIIAAIKMNYLRSGGEAEIPAEYFKAILNVADMKETSFSYRNRLMGAIMETYEGFGHLDGRPRAPRG